MKEEKNHKKKKKRRKQADSIITRGCVLLCLCSHSPPQWHTAQRHKQTNKQAENNNPPWGRTGMGILTTSHMATTTIVVIGGWSVGRRSIGREQTRFLGQGRPQVDREESQRE
ncbi:MAG: hypothetical protein J3R72DRAFT_460118 [Linnemannia gamsii]|nr:MAG: hypothetical protein J3R72DRAFT_460118 [Linnemannia gamsii]